MMQMAKKKKNKIAKRIGKAIIAFILILIKPFIIPTLIISILLTIATAITDIFNISYKNEDKIDMRKEMKYYDAVKEYEKEEMKRFLDSAWDFVENLFEGFIVIQTDWPVERSLFNIKSIW